MTVILVQTAHETKLFVLFLWRCTLSLFRLLFQHTGKIRIAFFLPFFLSAVAVYFYNISNRVYSSIAINTICCSCFNPLPWLISLVAFRHPCLHYSYYLLIYYLYRQNRGLPLYHNAPKSHNHSPASDIFPEFVQPPLPHSPDWNPSGERSAGWS